MLEYVPVQCQNCGEVVADESTPAASDADVGLKEVAPTDVKKRRAYDYMKSAAPGVAI